MLTETTAPSLLFITSLVSLILIAFQVSFLHKSRWDIHNAQSIRRLLALCVTIFVVFLSALSGILGLVASHAGRTGNRPRAARAGVSGKIIVVILQSGRKFLHTLSSKTQIRLKKSVLVSVYMMFLLNLKALVEPIPSSYSGILTFGKVRTLTAVMYSPLVASRWCLPPHRCYPCISYGMLQIPFSPLFLQLSKRTTQPPVFRRFVGFSFSYPCFVSAFSFTYQSAARKSTRSSRVCGLSSQSDMPVVFCPLLVHLLEKGIFRRLPLFSTRSGSHA